MCSVVVPYDGTAHGAEFSGGEKEGYRWLFTRQTDGALIPACSMAAAALGELFEMGIDQIEYAAEIAFEHHLGLTCDPICGLVQIPCIERNAVAAMRAINAVSLANFLSGSRKISLDMVIETMYETGKDMSHLYRETSAGGLAKLYKKKDDK